MNKHAEHIARLLDKQLNGVLTDAETVELEEWKKISQRHAGTVEEITNPELLSGHLKTLYQYDNTRMENRLESEFSAIRLRTIQYENSEDAIQPSEQEVAHRVVHRIHFLQTAWFRYAAAAIIVLSLGAYLWSTYEKKNPETAKSNAFPKNNDVMAPTLNRASYYSCQRTTNRNETVQPPAPWLVRAM